MRHNVLHDIFYNISRTLCPITLTFSYFSLGPLRLYHAEFWYEIHVCPVLCFYHKVQEICNYPPRHQLHDAKLIIMFLLSFNPIRRSWHNVSLRHYNTRTLCLITLKLIDCSNYSFGSPHAKFNDNGCLWLPW